MCNDLKLERIAVMTIGNSKVFETAKVIANDLDIPYISINQDLTSSDQIINKKKIKNLELNMHPPVTKIISAIIDLIHYYKWEFVTILFQEPSRIEDLIRYASNEFQNFKIHFQFTLISKDISEWTTLIKNVKSSGASRIIIDIEAKYINTFLRLVN